MQVLVQILIVVIVIGMIYSLRKTTKAYGGLIGTGLRYLGLGIVFFSLEALDRVLGNLSFVNSLAGRSSDVAHNLLLLLGLLFSAIGFSKLTKITK